MFSTVWASYARLRQTQKKECFLGSVQKGEEKHKYLKGNRIMLDKIVHTFL